MLGIEFSTGIFGISLFFIGYGLMIIGVLKNKRALSMFREIMRIGITTKG